MSDIIEWPVGLLSPRACRPTLVPFTRSGGASLGGVERVTRTDAGHWEITLDGVPVRGTAAARTLDTIAAHCGGRAGYVAVPAWSFDTAPYASGRFEAPAIVDHDDGTGFSDGTGYLQSAIAVTSAGAGAIGATRLTLRSVKSADDLVGVRFSHNHALYRTGRLIDLDGDDWTVAIEPPLRADIPAGSDLEFDRPTCLCRLATDTALARGTVWRGNDELSISFVEATEYWNDLAIGAAD